MGPTVGLDVTVKREIPAMLGIECDIQPAANHYNYYAILAHIQSIMYVTFQI
jgi:hypothetical protein